MTAGLPAWLALWLAGATAVLLLAAIAAALLRRRSAADRARLWSSALVLACALPLARPWLPRLPVVHPQPAAAARSPAVFPGRDPARSAPAPRDKANVDRPPAGWTALWLAGVAFGGFRLARAWRQQRRILAALRALPDRLAHSLRRAGRRLGLSRPPRAGLGPVASPCVCGPWRATVVLPAAAADGDRGRLGPVLLHELAHVAARDVPARWLGALAQVLLWPCPLVHWAARQQRREQERAADDRVLLAGVPAPAVAAGLLAATRAAGHGRTVPLAAGATAVGDRIGRLLRADLRRQPSAGGRALVRAHALAVLLVASLGEENASSDPAVALPAGIVVDATGRIAGAVGTAFAWLTDHGTLACTDDVAPTPEGSLLPGAGGWLAIEFEARGSPARIVQQRRGDGSVQTVAVGAIDDPARELRDRLPAILASAPVAVPARAALLLGRHGLAGALARVADDCAQPARGELFAALARASPGARWQQALQTLERAARAEAAAAAARAAGRP